MLGETIRLQKLVPRLYGPAPEVRRVRFLPGPEPSASRLSLARIFESPARHLPVPTLSCAESPSAHAQAGPLFSSGQQSLFSRRRKLFVVLRGTDRCCPGVPFCRLPFLRLWYRRWSFRQI